VLTEVLMADCVDRLINRRLRLPSYRRWLSQFKELRAASGSLTTGVSIAAARSSFFPMEQGTRRS
jgi:hypothetical protein